MSKQASVGLPLKACSGREKQSCCCSRALTDASRALPRLHQFKCLKRRKPHAGKQSRSRLPLSILSHKQKKHAFPLDLATQRRPLAALIFLSTTRHLAASLAVHSSVLRHALRCFGNSFLVRAAHGEIAEADDAHKFLVTAQDRQATHVLALHVCGNRGDVLVVVAKLDVAGHAHLHLGGLCVEAFRYAADRNVTVGDHAEKPVRGGVCARAHGQEACRAKGTEVLIRYGDPNATSMPAEISMTHRMIRILVNAAPACVALCHQLRRTLNALVWLDDPHTLRHYIAHALRLSAEREASRECPRGRSPKSPEHAEGLRFVQIGPKNVRMLQTMVLSVCTLLCACWCAKNKKIIRKLLLVAYEAPECRTTRNRHADGFIPPPE